MFCHRIAVSFGVLVLLITSFGVGSASASAGSYGSTAGDDLAGVVAAIGLDSAATGEPVNVVLAGATSRHTLETVGALAAAIGEHGQPAGWKVFNDLDDVAGDGSLIVIADGPGPEVEFSAVRQGQQSTVVLSGDARKLTGLANDLIGSRSGSDGTVTEVVLPNNWTTATLGEALGLIAGLTSNPEAGAPRLVTDTGANTTRTLIVVGDASAARLARLAGESAVPEILAYTDDLPPVLVVAAPVPDKSEGLPIVAIGTGLAAVAALGFVWIRRAWAARLIPATV